MTIAVICVHKNCSWITAIKKIKVYDKASYTCSPQVRPDAGGI